MLNYLKIKNLALIANAEVEFREGFNVVTGESGSGKTVLLNTVALLTGKRADKNLLRAGCDRCELSAEIAVDGNRNPEILAALGDSGIAFDPERPLVQLRRLFTAGDNRNFINDTPVTGATLKRIGELLVDIHSADEHHTLVHRARQLELLDRFGGHGSLLAEYRTRLEELKALTVERDARLSSLPSPDEAATLRAMEEEIAAVNPAPNEDETLAAQHKLAANAHEILQLVQSTRNQLCEGENSLSDALAGIYRELEQLARIDAAGAERFLTDCELIRESLGNLADGLERYGNGIELDEAAFAELETRLGALFALKRHYGPSLETVLNRWREAQDQLAVFQDFARIEKEYAERIATAEQALLAAAARLTAARHDAAADLSLKVTEKLRKLGFRYADFTMEFTRHEPEQSGVDAVDMIFSANPGLQPAPLRLVASSGEIARVMLALKAVLADADAIPVLIFDEIDVNIGGETGIQVGRELAALARCRQLLCISHLPQVAALGEHHYAVSKTVVDGIAEGAITPLSGTDRVREIARMLGGTAAAQRHAEALLAPPE